MVWSVRILFVKFKFCAIIDHCIVVTPLNFLLIVDTYIMCYAMNESNHAHWSNGAFWIRLHKCAGGQCRKNLRNGLIRVEFYTFNVALTRTLHPFPFELGSKLESVSVSTSFERRRETVFSYCYRYIPWIINSSSHALARIRAHIVCVRFYTSIELHRVDAFKGCSKMSHRFIPITCGFVLNIQFTRSFADSTN